MSTFFKRLKLYIKVMSFNKKKRNYEKQVWTYLTVYFMIVELGFEKHSNKDKRNTFSKFSKVIKNLTWNFTFWIQKVLQKLFTSLQYEVTISSWKSNNKNKSVFYRKNSLNSYVYIISGLICLFVKCLFKHFCGCFSLFLQTLKFYYVRLFR